MKRVLFMLTTALLLAIAGQPTQASQKSATAVVSDKATTEGYWTGYWTWDSVKHQWYWTWVWIPTSGGWQTS